MPNGSNPQPDPVMIGERSGLRYFTIRNEWAEEIAALEQASYPTADPSDLYDAAGIDVLATDFSEGCFAGFDGERLVAMGVGIRTNFDLSHPQHEISEIIPESGGSGHIVDGEWYYGSGIAVSDDYRRRGIGNELYRLRKGACKSLNLRGLVAGGVIPGYAAHVESMSADAYIDEVRAGRLYDPTLSFQLKNGFEVLCALSDYMKDPAVNNYASMIVWHNPDYQDSDLLDPMKPAEYD